MTLFPREKQVGDGRTVEMTLGDAVAGGVIDNQTLAYFVGRTSLYLLRCGIKPAGLRFRQHLKTEMAHYGGDGGGRGGDGGEGWIARAAAGSRPRQLTAPRPPIAPTRQPRTAGTQRS